MQEVFVKNVEANAYSSEEESFELVGILEETDETAEKCENSNKDLSQKLQKAMKKLKEKDIGEMRDRIKVRTTKGRE